jgi:hypothetical protein
MEDLIQNAHALFDERPSQSPPFSSPNVAEPMSSRTYASSLFSSPQLPQFAAGPATGSTPRHSPGLGAIRESPQSSFSSFPSDGSVDSRLTPPYTVLSPLLLDLSSSRTDDYASAAHTGGERHQGDQDFAK